MTPRTLLLSAILALGLVSATQAQSLSAEDIDRISASVVMIVGLQNGQPFSQGTGTIVDSRGIIYTNRHVIEGADDLAIFMLEDINERPVLRYYASELATFQDLDFSVLQIDRDERGGLVLPTQLNLPAIALAQREARRGERIYIFGYPSTGDGYLVVTSGLITTIQNGDIGGTRQPVWYQTDAEISPGNSGGLAVSLEGELIGIPTSVNAEERTLGRLGGILPFRAVQALAQAGANTIRVTRTRPSAPPSQVQQPDGSSQSSDPSGVVFTCDDIQVTNGIEIVVVQMRPGFTYTATVIGIGDFDPILYVGETTRRDQGLCNDDSRNAANVAVNLPGLTGVIEANSRSSSLSFSHSNRNLTDISFVVGSLNSTPGEFIFILEGMAVTPADGLGDPFSVYVTPGMIATGDPFMVAMIGTERQLDPYFFAADSNGDQVIAANGQPLVCDDGGTQYCNSASFNMDGVQLRTAAGFVFNADEYDAVLLVDPSTIPNPTTFYFSSSSQRSTGNYLLMFLFGTR
ncbi:MAG: serine protease [Anaerolineae bacterium]|nr:serine protease [Anaerolineae bacterium]MDW8171506.1 serine protease [Anaerolineae bacterium]